MRRIEPTFPPELERSLNRVAGWTGDPWLHLANNVSQWEAVYDKPLGEPSPEELKPLQSTGRTAGQPFGVEAPSSFWPKFEHRFRPAEEAWFADALSAVERASPEFHRARDLFDTVLSARDRLAAALPPDGRTPTSRAEGQAILKPMRELCEALLTFSNYVSLHSAPLSSGRKAKKQAREVAKAFEEERQRWWLEGPYENLNY